MPDEERKPKGGSETYRGDTSGGYGTGGAAADFEDVTGRKDVKLEDVFPEDDKKRGKNGEVTEETPGTPDSRPSE